MGEHGHLNVLVVLETIADDGCGVLGHRHDGEQLRLGPRFQTEPHGFTEL
jgi:hypothetical protein